MRFLQRSAIQFVLVFLLPALPAIASEAPSGETPTTLIVQVENGGAAGAARVFIYPVATARPAIDADSAREANEAAARITPEALPTDTVTGFSSFGYRYPYWLGFNPAAHYHPGLPASLGYSPYAPWYYSYGVPTYGGYYGGYYPYSYYGGIRPYIRSAYTLRSGNDTYLYFNQR